ncbi:hypothetical protein N9W65_03120 [Schleiferiaceae bacterium]|nr:hypothetical protein [Schleiferiaceae bacterium]
MSLKFVNEVSKEEFIAFNDIAFPERDNKQLIYFRYYNVRINHSERIREENIFILDPNGEILAQSLYHPASYYFKGETENIQWGFDLYVRQDKRKDSLGLRLMEHIAATKSTNIFASGVGEKALKVEKYFGYHVVGNLYKYYKIINPLYFLSGLMLKEDLVSDKFPSLVCGKLGKYKKIDISKISNLPQPYNTDLLEFGRDKHFLQWRFASGLFNYVTYSLDNERSELVENYFVVRTIKYKGVTCLVLVDYRCNIRNKNAIRNIISVVNIIAQKLLIPIVVTGSSLKKIDEVLCELGYRTTGIPRPIVCNDEALRSYKDPIQSRRFVLSTLADSDGEYTL